MIDHGKQRRESMRWNMLSTLNKNRPYTLHEARLGEIVQALYPDASPLEVRRELDYLADRQLVEITKEPSGSWFADLTRHGIDLAEYTVDCEPGVARPPKYWVQD
ncbi:MAG: hypothetical protein KBD39_11080 [Sterolibacterium sp.]|nr:hypothetical protein [Sterolibacterium sp.]